MYDIPGAVFLSKSELRALFPHPQPYLYECVHNKVYQSMRLKEAELQTRDISSGNLYDWNLAFCSSFLILLQLSVFLKLSSRVGGG